LTGWVYGAAACGLGGWFLFGAWRVWAGGDEKRWSVAEPRALFKFSILYLFALFAALVADVWLLGSPA
jgi:heme o synthase